MASASAPAHLPASRSLAGVLLRHAVSLVFPLTSLAFLWTGPHAWWVATLFLAPGVVLYQLDRPGRPLERRPPLEGAPEWPFDLLVYGLAALQLLVVASLVRLFAAGGQHFFSFDMLGVLLVVGSSSGFSIVTAHELIHRRSRGEQRLGRLLLCTVLYEHFFTEHLRGHHARVGTPADPATARFGESYEAFFRRTVPAQLRSAWRLETRRLGDPEMGLLDRRLLRSRVLHGLLVEWGLALGILALFGVVAFAAFVLQAFMAVRLLEAVNYFEHWGLRRRGKRVTPADSWDTHSWLTYYSLIGLTRHADHHAHPTRPYPRLRLHPEAPVLPAGYVVTVDDVIGKNAEFQRYATLELARRRAGPFAPAEGEAGERAEPADEATALARLEAAQAAERRPAGPGARAARRAWGRIPRPLRVGLVLAALVGATALGAHAESGGAELGLAARLALHGAVLGTLVALLALRARLVPRLGEGLSWVPAFAGVAAAGPLLSMLF